MDIMLICLLFVQVSELFLLSFPGSLLQFSHMNIQLNQICETGMNQNIS